MDDAPNPPAEESLSVSQRHGSLGERLAAEFLVREKRFRIIARNWRNPADEREELDLVAYDEDILVFIEVKTRSDSALVPGFFHVGSAKKKVLRRAALAFLRRHRPKPRTFRLDVVEVQIGANDRTVRHFVRIPLFDKFTRA